MTSIPRSALILGLAGLIPFIWGGITSLNPELGMRAAQTFGGRLVGPYIQLGYGTVILAFMSGALWGFAAKAEGPTATVGYALATIPALWAFFMVGGGPTSAAMNLIFGFLGLLLLDGFFWKQGLAPRWWMSLRLGLTALAILCIIPAAL